MKNRIGWCSITWNPVVGCRNNCEYCYARRINTRFKFVKYWNKPEWKEKSFNKSFPKKPQRMFVGSMSEIYYWDKVWIQRVIDKIKEYPQHTFQFLTKYPDVYNYWYFHPNCWLGITINKDTDIWDDEIDTYNKFFGLSNIKFISIEPILEEIKMLDFIEGFDWVIIGAETGNRKGKVIPKKEWIEEIVNYCKGNNIPIYLKDSLKEIYPLEIKEFPNYK